MSLTKGRLFNILVVEDFEQFHSYLEQMPRGMKTILGRIVGIQNIENNMMIEGEMRDSKANLQNKQ